MTEKLLPRLGANIDIIAGLIGIFLGIFIIYLSFTTSLRQQDIGFVIFSTSLIYLVLRNKYKKTSFTPLKIDHRGRLLLNILFFCIFSVTLWIWYTQLYCRPLSYFILISFLTGIVAVEILCFDEGNTVWQILFKIILLSANIRAGIFYNFPSIMGYDAYGHAKIAELITDTGFVAPFEISRQYFYYPVVHAFISITQVVCQLDIKDAIFCSIGLASILSTIFIYLIVKELAGPQIGLLAALLVNVTNSIIVRGITNITAGSLVLCYFVLLLYLLFKKEHKFMNSLLLIIITLLMIITHQLSTFVVFICLASIYLGKAAYKIICGSKESVDNNIAYILFFAVTLQLYWTHTYTFPGTTFFDFVIGSMTNVLKTGGEYGSNTLIVGPEYHISMFDTVLLHSSYLILPFFAIGGVLLWLSLREDKKFSIAVVIIILYLFVYGLPLLGIRNLLTSRWVPFLSIFLVIVASAYIFKIVDLIKSNRNKVFAIFTIAVIFSFLMITTPAINKDNPLVAKDTTCRNQFTGDEMCAVATLSDVRHGPIRLDSSLHGCYLLYAADISSDQQIKSKSQNLGAFDIGYITTPTQEESGTLIILRKCTLKEPVTVKVSKLYGIPKAQLLPKEFFDRFESKGYDLVYNNGGVKGCVSR